MVQKHVMYIELYPGDYMTLHKIPHVKKKQ